MNKRIKKIINVAILVLIVIFSSVGCSSDSKYSDLLTKYIEINNDYTNQKITKEIIDMIKYRVDYVALLQDIGY